MSELSDKAEIQHDPTLTIEAAPKDVAVVPTVQENNKPDIIRDNGPRIVGGIKLVPDLLLLKSGLQDTGKAPFRATAALGFMGSRLLLLKYGSKDRQKDTTPAEDIHNNDSSLVGMVKHNVHKVTHPNQYPVESGAGVAALAGVSVALSGATLMRRKETFSVGIKEFGVGIFTALAEGNVLFGKEKAKPAKDSTEVKESKGIIQKLKDQPVLLSGITQAAVSGLQIFVGMETWKQSKKNPVQGKGKSWQYLAAASIYTAADLIYAFFVRKNEFNTEAKATPAEKQPQPEQSQASEVIGGDDIARKLNWQESVQQSAAKDSSLALS